MVNKEEVSDPRRTVSDVVSHTPPIPPEACVTHPPAWERSGCITQLEAIRPNQRRDV